MKAGWEIKKLGNISKINYGYTEKASFEIDGPKFLRITDIQDNSVDWDKVPSCKITNNDFEKFRLNDGDIVFARTGATTGKSYLVQNPKESVFASYLIKLSLKEKIAIPDFLHLFFQTKEYWDRITSGISGSAQGGFNASKLAELDIPLPPLPEQRRIVAILDEAFAGIAAAKENAEQNLKNAKEVFASYLKQIFNTKKNGWINDNIGEICLLKSGTTMPHDLEKETGDIPYLKVADINFEKNIGCITMSSRFLDKKDIKNSMIIPKGAVIFPKRGGAILTNKKRMTSIPICADLNIMAVIPTGKIESKLLYYYFLDVDMKKIGTGSSIPQINNYDISPLSITYPRDLSKQKEIVSFLDEISEETGTLESIYQQKLSNLQELKKSLLQQAFSGAL